MPNVSLLSGLQFISAFSKTQCFKGRGISGLGWAKYVSGFGHNWLICLKKKKKWRTDPGFTDFRADNLPTLPHSQGASDDHSQWDSKESAWCLSIRSCWAWRLCSLGYLSEFVGAPADTVIVESVERLVLLALGVIPGNDSYCLEKGELKHGLMSSEKNAFKAIASDSPWVSWAAHGFPTGPLL